MLSFTKNKYSVNIDIKLKYSIGDVVVFNIGSSEIPKVGKIDDVAFYFVSVNELKADEELYRYKVITDEKHDGYRLSESSILGKLTIEE